MKKVFSLLSLVLLLAAQKSAAQDMIYFLDGSKVPGKITEITADKVKYRNLANPNGPIYSKSLSGVLAAFNKSGDYLIFSQAKPSAENERAAFLAGGAPRAVDVVIDGKGRVLAGDISDENEKEVLMKSGGKPTKLNKSDLVFYIKKDGTHRIFTTCETALPYLAINKTKIAEASDKPEPATAVDAGDLATSGEVGSLAHSDSDEVIPDLVNFGAKALKKTEEFTGYIKAITSSATNKQASTKSINMAVALFLDEEARVEVSNVRTGSKNKYKIRDYLNRLMMRSGQYDQVSVEYANISYASKFRKGPDGNYYGSVTFVQKFQGFIDGNLVYSDATKRSVTVVLKHYEKAVQGQIVEGWDVFLDDVGVVETKKL